MQQLPAQVKTVGDTHFNVQKNQCHRILFEKVHDIHRLGKPDYIGLWHDLPQGKDTPFENDGLVVHQKDVRSHVRLLHGGHQRYDVNAQRVGQQGD